MLGDSGQGKSAIVIKFVTDNFVEEHDKTIEGSFFFFSQTFHDLHHFETRHQSVTDYKPTNLSKQQISIKNIMYATMSQYY